MELYKVCINHGPGLYKVCINHDPEMTLTYFMARSAEVAYRREQGNVYRTIGPLVLIFDPKHKLWVLVRTALARQF